MHGTVGQEETEQGEQYKQDDLDSNDLNTELFDVGVKVGTLFGDEHIMGVPFIGGDVLFNAIVGNDEGVHSEVVYFFHHNGMADVLCCSRLMHFKLTGIVDDGKMLIFNALFILLVAIEMPSHQDENGDTAEVA